MDVPLFKNALQNMKNIFYASATLLLLSMVLAGCHEELKNVRGVVKGIQISKDTLKAISISINEKGDTLLFSLNDARLQNGLMMPKDSVIVDYINGRNDTLRALVVTVIPNVQPSLPVQIDTLVTAPQK